MEWEARNRDRRNAYRRSHPVPSNQGDARHGYAIQYNYGLTPDEYQGMLEAQDGSCAICDGPGTRRLAVDYCHSTLKIRGLLRDKCNLGLGLFQDSPALMKRAIDYLAP
jgi:hypothetical protein